MTPPAAKRRRSVDHSESTRNINVVKGGLSIMCPADSMGMLIGKGGSGLRGMQEKSGVKVSLQETKSMPEGAKERGVGLSGSLVNVAAVEKIIFEKLNARRVTSLAPSPAEEEFEIAYQAAKAAGVPVSAITENDSDPAKVTVCRWVMDNSHCGWLIGKGGSGIQNIEATSGAEVRVATEKSMTKDSQERIVYIKGTPFQREKALDMIRSNPKISGRVAGPKEPEMAAVHVPSKAIGFILGHRGASIQALTEKTGAQLRVAPSSEITTGSSEHRVDITGGPQQIVAARHALAARIEEWRATTNPSSAPEEIEYSIKIAVPQPLVGHIIGKGGQFVREVLAITSVQVKIQQDTGSPTLWGDACCVMLSGTMDNVVQAQQMILERIANISDRLKDMVPNAVTLCPDQDPEGLVRKLEVNIQLPDGPPPSQSPHPFQQPPPFGQQPPAFGFAPQFGQPGPGGPFMPGQQQFQPQFQPQFQQPPQQQQPGQQVYRPSQPSGPPGDEVMFTSIRQLNAPGLTSSSKQPGGMEMLVDNSVVGSIIGKGGQTIRKISTESGATIQVQGRDDVSPSQRERRVTVTSDDMPALMKAANMICGVLRNNEKMSNASRQGGPPGAGGGPPGSNGAAGGGDRERGAPRGGPGGPGGPHNGPRGGSGGPPTASPSGGPTPASFPYQQQQLPVPYSQTPAMAAFPPQQGFVAQQPVQGGAPVQQAYPYPQQVPGQGPSQQQQLVQQAPGQGPPQQQQQPPAQGVAGQFAQQGQQPPQQGQQPPQQGQQPGQPQQQGQPGQQPGGAFYQPPAGANGPPQGGNPQYAQAQQQAPPQQPQQAPQQQQQQPGHMQQQSPQQLPVQQLPVQQLPLQGQGQAPPASGASAPPTASPAPVYGWVYDPASGTYTAAPAAATPAPQSSSFPAQPQYSQQQQQQPPPQQQQQPPQQHR